MRTTTYAPTYASLGSISSGTLRNEDLIDAFAYALRKLAPTHPLLADVDAFCDPLDYGSDAYDGSDAADLVAELEDALSTFAPPYAYFGAHPGDGAEIGFWLCEDWQQSAIDDDVPMLGDLSEVDALDVPHGAHVCVINDHGNATLYVMDYAHAGSTLSQLREVWSVV